MRFSTLLFDLDGTLIDSVGDIAAARKALTELHKNAADFRNELRRSGDQ